MLLALKATSLKRNEHFTTYSALCLVKSTSLPIPVDSRLTLPFADSVLVCGREQLLL